MKFLIVFAAALVLGWTFDLSEKQENILNLHNVIRRKISDGLDDQPAGNIPDLSYWVMLEDYAHKHLSHLCETEKSYRHIGSRNRIGINKKIYRADRKHGEDWNKVIHSWFERHRNYTFGDSSTNNEYTQLVWENTDRVGCYAGLIHSNHEICYICLYAPGGNILGELPYEKKTYNTTEMPQLNNSYSGRSRRWSPWNFFWPSYPTARPTPRPHHPHSSTAKTTEMPEPSPTSKPISPDGKGSSTSGEDPNELQTTSSKPTRHPHHHHLSVVKTTENPRPTSTLKPTDPEGGGSSSSSGESSSSSEDGSFESHPSTSKPTNPEGGGSSSSSRESSSSSEEDSFESHPFTSKPTNPEGGGSSSSSRESSSSSEEDSFESHPSTSKPTNPEGGGSSSSSGESSSSSEDDSFESHPSTSKPINPEGGGSWSYSDKSSSSSKEGSFESHPINPDRHGSWASSDDSYEDYNEMNNFYGYWK